MAKKVTIELTEKQAQIVLAAVDEWFRLRMGQYHEFAYALAFLGYKSDKESKKEFDTRVGKRNAITHVLRAAYYIAFPYEGAPKEIEPEVHIASDIWSALRYKLRDDGERYKPFRMGAEPLPKITVEGTEDG